MYTYNKYYILEIMQQNILYYYYNKLLNVLIGVANIIIVYTEVQWLNMRQLSNENFIKTMDIFKIQN